MFLIHPTHLSENVLKFFDTLPTNINLLKQYGNILFNLLINNLISSDFIENILNIDILIGYFIELKSNGSPLILQKTNNKLLVYLDKQLLSQAQKITLTDARDINGFTKVKPKIEDRLETRSNKQWSLFIQEKNQTKETYKVEEDSKHILKDLISNLYLKEVFKIKGKDISAFSLFQKGSPEWKDHLGGGRFIIKTTEWETKYDEFFCWLQSLGKSTETFTLLNSICGIRFKIIKVQNLFTVEVWFTSINKHKKELEEKLKTIFIGSLFKTDYFEDDFKSKKQNQKHSNNERNSHHSNMTYEPRKSGSGDLRSVPKSSGDLRSVPKSSGDLRSVPKSSGDLRSGEVVVRNTSDRFIPYKKVDVSKSINPSRFGESLIKNRFDCLY